MNPRGVTLLGFELSRIYLLVWAHLRHCWRGSPACCSAMFLGVSSDSVGPLTASAFSIVVLGGLGSVSGSLIAAYVVGYLETLTAYLISPAYRSHSGAAAADRRRLCAAARPAGAALRCGAPAITRSQSPVLAGLLALAASLPLLAPAMCSGC